MVHPTGHLCVVFISDGTAVIVFWQ
uniref:Uncharacterized protein n=1 Tax=Anguilla anguilla TaxID=7936 RepID=A0A0E9RRC0_ANGAN